MSHRQKWSVIAALAIGLSAAALVVSVWPRRPAITFDVPVADSYSLELSFSRSSTIIAITSRLRAGAVKFYDASSGALLSTWERPWWVHWDGGCLGVGEKWIATTWEKHGDDYQVIEVDPRDGTESVLLRRPWSELTLRRSEFDREQHLSDPVAITPDGAMWLHALPKGGVEIWELATGHQIRIVDEHAIKNIAVSPDSKLLAAFARDGVVRVWELRTGKQFTAYPELKEFAEENTSIKINDDGRVLLEYFRSYDEIGNYAARAILGPKSGDIEQIPDRRVVHWSSSGSTVLTSEPYLPIVQKTLAAPRRREGHPPKALWLEDRNGSQRWRCELQSPSIRVHGFNPIATTPSHVLGFVDEDRVSVVDLTDGTTTWSICVNEKPEYYVAPAFALSADGRFVAYARPADSREIARIDIWRL